MKNTNLFLIPLFLLMALVFTTGDMSAAPPPQTAEDVIQIVLVLDVSGSMDTEVFTGIVPEDLLSLLFRKGEIQNDPEFIQFQEQMQEAEQDPQVMAAKEKWDNAAEALDEWMIAEYGRDTTSVQQDVHDLLAAAGCEDTMDRAITTVGNLEELDFSLNVACPEGVVTDELRQGVIDLLPYLNDPEYQELRQDWKAAFQTYDDLLEESGYKSAAEQLEELKVESGLDEIEEEIDRLVELYNIPTRLELAKTAAINLIDLSRLDQANTGRESWLGLVTFSNQAQLNHELTLDHERLKGLIRGLKPLFQTNIGAALNTGLNELGRSVDPEQPLLIILLSDGHANVGMSSAEILAAIPPRANAMDVTICTAGFADLETEVDFVLLEGLAQKTDGEYLFTNSGSELGSFFVACREGAVGKNLAGQFSGVVEAGNRSDVGSVEIESHTCQLNATLNFLSGSPELHLVNPGGQTMDPSQGGISYQKRNQVQLFSVEEPQAGQWLIRVSNDDAAGETSTFSILVSTTPCEGPGPDVEETDRYAGLPFLLTERGMPYATAFVLVVILLLFGGVMLIIRRRQGGGA